MIDMHTGKYWVRFDKRYHTRDGLYRIKIKDIDHTTGFMTEKSFPVIFKTGTRDLFMTNEEQTKNVTFIENSRSQASFGISFNLHQSDSELLNSSFLNSSISEDSGTHKLLSDLRKIDEAITSAATSGNAEHVLAHFTKEFQAHTYINFTGGFILTEEEFSKFTQDKPVDMRNFEKYLGTYNRAYSANTTKARKEQMAKMKMLHTMGTVHLTELYGNQVNSIPEEHRKRAQVTPDVAKGLAKRMLVNVKHDVCDWVLAKMT